MELVGEHYMECVVEHYIDHYMGLVVDHYTEPVGEHYMDSVLADNQVSEGMVGEEKGEVPTKPTNQKSRKSITNIFEPHAIYMVTHMQ